MDIYEATNYQCSKIITQKYSTSFSLGILAFAKEVRNPIYAIYALVRFADEIVDTFHHHKKEELLQRFEADTYQAIKEKISLNPVLHSFQLVVNEYNIEYQLIHAFFRSMEMDLNQIKYNSEKYEEYIYGSAQVVGLMCLRVFLKNQEAKYDELKDYARSLGSAFQKINFLRDIKDDFEDKGRTYFPEVNFTQNFTQKEKEMIENDIKKDFDSAYQGIIRLPVSCRFGVLIAYIFYLSLFNKIKKTPAQKIMNERIRISNSHKLFLFAYAFYKSKVTPTYS